MSRDNRIGRFHLSQELFEALPDLVRHVQSLVLILRVECRWDMRAFEYIASGEIFEQVEPGTAAPDYILLFDEPLELTMIERKIVAEKVGHKQMSFSGNWEQLIPEKFRKEWTEIVRKIEAQQKKIDENERRFSTPAADPAIAKVCDSIEEAMPGLKYTEEEQQEIADQKHAAQMADLEPDDSLERERYEESNATPGVPSTESSAPESEPIKGNGHPANCGCDQCF